MSAILSNEGTKIRVIAPAGGVLDLVQRLDLASQVGIFLVLDLAVNKYATWPNALQGAEVQ